MLVARPPHGNRERVPYFEPLADAAAAELLHRLDAEERQRGHDAW